MRGGLARLGSGIRLRVQKNDSGFVGAEAPSLLINYYDAVYMIRDAIVNQKLTGSPSKLKDERKAISDYISNVKGFQGVMFTWDMKDGIPTNKPNFLFKIEDSKKVLVEEVTQ